MEDGKDPTSVKTAITPRVMLVSKKIRLNLFFFIPSLIYKCIINSKNGMTRDIIPLEEEYFNKCNLFIN